jgi:hypothetical protein
MTAPAFDPAVWYEAGMQVSYLGSTWVNVAGSKVVAPPTFPWVPANSGGGSFAIAAASDYDNTTPATDGQAVEWNAGESKFKPATVGTSGQGAGEWMQVFTNTSAPVSVPGDGTPTSLALLIDPTDIANVVVGSPNGDSGTVPSAFALLGDAGTGLTGITLVKKGIYYVLREVIWDTAVTAGFRGILDSGGTGIIADSGPKPADSGLALAQLWNGNQEAGGLVVSAADGAVLSMFEVKQNSGSAINAIYAEIDIYYLGLPLT